MFLFNFFVVVCHLATYIFLSFNLLNDSRLGAVFDPGMAFTLFPFSLFEIRTHHLSITSQDCYPLDRTFALDYNTVLL